MSSYNDKTRVAVSVTSCIYHDQRVLKIAGIIRSLDCDILLIGRNSDNYLVPPSFPFRIRRFNMVFTRGFLFYIFFNLRLFFFLLFNKFDLLVANDLDTLLPNFLVSKIKNLELVYDSHEYFTGVPEIQDRPFVKWVWTKIERAIFPRLKKVMTVSDSIANQYAIEYGLRPLTVRNCSLKTGHIVPFRRDEIDLSPDHLLLILQGGGINVDRGGEELIEAIAMTEGVSLLVIGSGDMFEVLEQKVLELKLRERIRFIKKIPWKELMRYTRAADAGLSLDKNTNPNYTYSLPNKLFDYISAGIPVIASDLPEISKIINEYNCGILIPVPEPGQISRAIKEIRDNRPLLSELKRNSVIASETLNWDNESRKVDEFYRLILKKI